MKRLLLLSLLLTVLLSSTAFGARQDFGEFSVDVPKGWSVNHDGSRVTLTKGRMIVEIELASMGKKSLDTIAKEIAQQYGSEDCEDIEDYYIFTYTEDGVESFGRVSAPEEGMYLLVLMTPHDDNDVMFNIEDSIRLTSKNSETVKTLNTQYFTFAIPKGWYGYEIDETSVKVEREDESASMYAEIADLDDWEPEELGRFYAKEHKAKDLKNDGGSWSFSYEEDGKMNVATFATDKDVYILIIQTASDKAGFDSVAKLRGALKRK